jgi:hypothetical protein
MDFMNENLYQLLTCLDGGRARPYDTVLPLSQDLGLVINSMIGSNDVKAAAEAARAYSGRGNVLVCWEHGQLAKIAEASEYQFPDACCLTK